jgi:hypothetical protein
MTIKNIILEKARPYIETDKKTEAINRLFAYDQCFAFKDDEGQGFDLMQKIADYFNISLRSVHIVGSAQLGHSFFKDRNFNPGESDLDVAIVNTELFLRYYEFCYVVTKQYKDKTNFPKHGELEPNEVAKRFMEYLARGYIRPDYMPYSKKRSDWMTFFNKLGNTYISKFKKITCGIYLSQTFFSMKQQEILTEIERVL